MELDSPIVAEGVFDSRVMHHISRLLGYSTWHAWWRWWTITTVTCVFGVFAFVSCAVAGWRRQPLPQPWQFIAIVALLLFCPLAAWCFNSFYVHWRSQKLRRSHLPIRLRYSIGRDGVNILGNNIEKLTRWSECAGVRAFPNLLVVFKLVRSEAIYLPREFVASDEEWENLSRYLLARLPEIRG
jgi:hypothetical protein